MKMEVEYKVFVIIYDKLVGCIYLVKVSKMKWVFQFEIVFVYGVYCIGIQIGGFYRLSDKKIIFVL